MIALMALLASEPFAGHFGEIDYQRCMLSAVTSHDDGRSAPANIVKIADAVCLKEDLQMQADWKKQVADDLRDRQPALGHIDAVANDRAASAAQATRTVVRNLALGRIRYLRSKHPS